MSIKDNNRAALVRTLIKQNGGRIFTVIARRKQPTITYFYHEGLGIADDTGMKQADYKRGVKKGELNPSDFVPVVDNFMEMTCRTGVKKDLVANKIQSYSIDDILDATPFSPASITVDEFNALSDSDKLAYSPVYKETKSSIAHCPDLISVNLTNGKGYRCFSTFMVLEIRAGGAVIKFKEADVLAYVEVK